MLIVVVMIGNKISAPLCALTKTGITNVILSFLKQKSQRD